MCLTLLITCVIRFCRCVSNRPLSKRDTNALVSTVFVVLTFQFSPEKDFSSSPLSSPSFCLHGALHDDTKNDWIASPPESLLA